MGKYGVLTFPWGMWLYRQRRGCDGAAIHINFIVILKENVISIMCQPRYAIEFVPITLGKVDIDDTRL